MYMYTYYIYMCVCVSVKLASIYGHVHIHIYTHFFSTIISLNPSNPGKRTKNEGLKMHVPYYVLFKQKHFEKVTQGTPLGGLSPQNNVHILPQLVNTLSPPGLIVLILSALLHELITNGGWLLIRTWH